MTLKTTVSHVRNKSSVDLSQAVFNRAAKLIPPEHYVLFTSAETLKRKLSDLQASKGASISRLLVTNVTDEKLGAATAELPFKKKKMRIWRDLEDVIIRVMSSSKHEITSRSRYSEILSAILKILCHDIYSIVGVGATRFHSPGKGSKEGDEGIRCATRQTINWPNLMIEVGNSEPLP